MNVVEVAEGREADFERAFAQRERLLAQVDGFVSFELLRPAPGEAGGGSHHGDAPPTPLADQRSYVVLTRWVDEAAFRTWVGSEHFARSHRERTPGLAVGAALRTFEVIEAEGLDA